MSWAELTWYVARGGGMTAFALLGLSVVLGLVLSLRLASPRWPRMVTHDLHEHLTLLALAFTGVHVLAIVLNPAVEFGLADVLIPFAASYQPVWTAAGVIAAELAVAVWVSTRFRHRIGYRRWRTLHMAAFAVFALALLHGLVQGTDTGSPWALAVYVPVAAAVAGLTALRVMASRTGAAARRAPARPAAAGPHRP
jgi:predicted ferric reductase